MRSAEVPAASTSAVWRLREALKPCCGSRRPKPDVVGRVDHRGQDVLLAHPHRGGQVVGGGGELVRRDDLRGEDFGIARDVAQQVLEGRDCSAGDEDGRTPVVQQRAPCRLPGGSFGGGVRCSMRGSPAGLALPARKVAAERCCWARRALDGPGVGVERGLGRGRGGLAQEQAGGFEQDQQAEQPQAEPAEGMGAGCVGRCHGPHRAPGRGSKSNATKITRARLLLTLQLAQRRQVRRSSQGPRERSGGPRFSTLDAYARAPSQTGVTASAFSRPTQPRASFAARACG